MAGGELLWDLLPKVFTAVEVVAFALTLRTFNTGLLYSLVNNLRISKLRADDMAEVHSEIMKGITSFRQKMDKEVSNAELQLRMCGALGNLGLMLSIILLQC